MTELPFEIQTNAELYGLNETLRGKRAELETSVADLSTGSYSAKNIFSKLINEIDLILNLIITSVEKVIIPEDEYADFVAGDITLDVYASFDLLKYYNGVRKLSNFLNGFRVALISLQNAPTKPITQNFQTEGDILENLNSNEFIEQGPENPVYDDAADFYNYTIISGDTLQIIANKVFNGDTNRWPEIAELNQISDNDIIDTDMVGVVIKIPTEAGTINQNENNLVFEQFYNGNDQSAIEQFIYGQDLKVNNKCFEISSTNDLRRVKGVACYTQNIQSRFDAKQGSLNPSAEEWGLEPIQDYANIPPVISLDRLLTAMEAQALEDGRTLNAQALRRTIRQTGDRVDVDMEIFLIGGRSITESFSAST